MNVIFPMNVVSFRLAWYLNCDLRNPKKDQIFIETTNPTSEENVIINRLSSSHILYFILCQKFNLDKFFGRINSKSINVTDKLKKHFSEMPLRIL